MFGGKSFTPDNDIPNLSGKVYLVTGGNTGLGKETILQLAKHKPAHIYLAARTAAKAENAIKEIEAAVPGANISFLSLDLTSFASVAEAARSFTSQSQRLDVLINNAGIMATPAGTTKEGYEVQFGTNHMGHALLTKLLLPTLLSTAEQPHADVRIINLTSEGHNLAPSGGILFDKTKLDAQGTWARYGQSKLANLLYTKELAAHYPTITSVAVHPGIIKTDLYEPNKGSNALLRYGMSLLGPLFFASLQEGAKNQLWAATTKKEDLQNGAYYKPIASLSKGSTNAQNDKLANTLWSWTEGELEKKGY
ncbi:hypothetical protein MMC11_000690 [Xylographa trunciseda]|nr:hypothetical protein [Xylographa trunciseda]